MKIKNTVLFLVVISLFILLFSPSCNKQEDKTFTNIWLNQPVNGTEIIIGDTFLVRGGFSDKTGVNYLRVQLVNINNESPVSLASKSFNKMQNYNFSFACALNDENLPSGQYFIKATAYNDWYVSNTFVNISIPEIPLELQKTYILLSASPLSFKLSKLTENGLEFIKEFPGNYVASSISSKFKQLYLAYQNNAGLLSAFDLNTYNLAWKTQAGQPFPDITDLVTNEEMIYYATGNGEINGLSSDGTTKLITPFNNDTFPLRITVFKDYIISNSKIRTGGKYVLMNYFKETGAFSHREPVSLDVKGFFPYSPHEVLVFSNNNGIGSVDLYDPYLRHLDHVADLNFKVTQATAISDNIYFLADTARLYKYYANTNSFSTYKQIEGITALIYEPVNYYLYVGNKNRLIIFDYQNGNLIREVETNAEVHDIEMLYNKTP